MSDIDDLRARLVVVEDQVKQLAGDAAATRALAAMADRDVAAFRQEMRGHTRVLNALRETQLEQGQKLQEQSRTLAQHGQTLGSLAAGQAAIMRHMGITQPDSAEQPPDVD